MTALSRLRLAIATAALVLPTPSVTVQARENVVGTVETIESRHLEDSREVFVHLPGGYAHSEQRYPVLYLLDGHIYFHHAVGYAKALAQFDKTPPFLVVGIESKRPQRFRFYGDREQAFRSFLQDEVFPLVEAGFRTNGERILFGWEYGGGFVLRWLAESPSIARGYVAASPVPLDQALIDGVKQAVDGGALADASLYFAFGDDQGRNESAVEALTSLLLANEAKGPNWRYEHLAGTHHNLTPHRALHSGLLHHYGDYEWLSFASLADFRLRGGLESVIAYYDHRGRKYGVSPSIHRQTMHNLVLLAYRADDIETFAHFLDAFEGFIAGTNHGWCNRFAAFLLENDRPAQAVQLLDVAVERFAESPALHAYRGQAFEELGEVDRARSSWARAVSLAQSSDDDRLHAYQTRLEALEKTRP